MRVDADEFAAFLLVGNNIVNGGFGRGSGSRRNCNDRHALVFCRRHAFQRNNVGKFGVVDDNAYAFGRILRRTAADGDHVVGAGFSEGFHAGLNHFDARIGFDFVKNLVSHLVGVQNVGHFFNYLKLYQIGVGNNQCFFETSAFDFRHNLVNGAVPVVAGFV